MSFAHVLLPLIILSCGSFFLIKLRMFFILRPVATFKEALRGEGLRESIGSLLLALSGTLGVGNIAGVALAIYVGGAGSVFWLIASALFSSAIKYAEIMISFDTGGGIGILSSVKRYLGRVPAATYAILGILLSLTMGTALQSEAIRSSAEGIGGFDFAPHAFPIFIVTLFICVFGKSGIRRAVSFIIPIASLAYSAICLAVIIPNIQALPQALALVFRSAFSIDSAAGGIGGFLFSSGIKEGFSRGLLSNEAGAGTSAFSHTSEDSKNYLRSAVFGVAEVFFDTVILCSMTAFAILLGFPGGNYPEDIGAFGALIGSYTYGVGGYILFFSIISFAVATTLCWYYYGRVCLGYLFGKRGRAAFFILFFASFAAGLIYDGSLTVTLTDLSLFAMTVITVLTIIKGSDRITLLSEPYLRKFRLKASDVRKHINGCQPESRS